MADEFAENLVEALAALERLDPEFIATGKRMLRDDHFVADILFAAALNRGLQLLHGFTLMVRAELFIPAAPLVRLQIDNCCRVFAGSLVENVDTLTVELLEGKRLDKLKGKDGKRLTDAYLLEQLSIAAEEPWLISVYEKASGFVHFSGAHLFHTAEAGPEREMTLRIHRKETRVPPRLWVEMVEAFTAATNLLLRLANGWAHQKEEERAHENGDV